MPDSTFDRPDLSAFTRLDGLGLEVTGQHIEPDHAVLACRIAREDWWCRRRGCQGLGLDTVIRCLAHAPYGWRTFIIRNQDNAGVAALIDDFSNRRRIHSSLGGTLAIDCVPHQSAWTRAV